MSKHWNYVYAKWEWRLRDSYNLVYPHISGVGVVILDNSAKLSMVKPLYAIRVKVKDNAKTV